MKSPDIRNGYVRKETADAMAQALEKAVSDLREWHKNFPDAATARERSRVRRWQVRVEMYRERQARRMR